MYYGRAFTILAFAAVLGQAAVVDRIAVIVGRRVVKSSDIDRELRASSFLNGQPLNESPAERRKAAERLIDQELMRQELLAGQYAQPTQADAAAFLQQLKRDRFHNSDTQFRAQLARHGLTEDQLQRQLLWQITVLRFIDQRFRPSVVVTDEEAASYFREHLAALQNAYPRNNSFEALLPKIRETLTGERINQLLEEWLTETRHGIRIEYREQAFSRGPSQ
jgi:hypothetical protein